MKSLSAISLVCVAILIGGISFGAHASPDASPNASRREQLDACIKQAKEKKLVGPPFGKFMRSCLNPGASEPISAPSAAASSASAIFVETNDLSLKFKPLARPSSPQ